MNLSKHILSIFSIYSILIFLVFFFLLSCKDSNEVTSPPPTISVPAKLDSAKIAIVAPSTNTTLFGKFTVLVVVKANTPVQSVKLFINGETDSTLTLTEPPYIYDFNTRKFENQSELNFVAFVKANHRSISSNKVTVKIAKFKSPYLHLLPNKDRVSIYWYEDFDFEDGHILERRKNDEEFELVSTFSPEEKSYTDFPKDTSATYSYRVRSYKDTIYTAYSNIEKIDYKLTEYKRNSIFSFTSLENSWGSRYSPIALNSFLDVICYAPENYNAIGFRRLNDYGQHTMEFRENRRILTIEESQNSPYFWVGFSNNTIIRITVFPKDIEWFNSIEDSVTAIAENTFVNELVFGTSNGSMGVIDLATKQYDIWRNFEPSEITDIEVFEGQIFYRTNNNCIYRFDRLNGIADCIEFPETLTEFEINDERFFASTIFGDLLYSSNISVASIGIDYEIYHSHDGIIWDLSYSENRLVTIGSDNRINLFRIDENDVLEKYYSFEVNRELNFAKIINSKNNDKILFTSARQLDWFEAIYSWYEL